MSVNKAILIGNMGKDPELKDVGGTSVCNFSLATNRTWKDKDGAKQEKATWHSCVAWGKTAETISNYVKKGQQLYIEGRIDNRTYEKEAGTKGYASDIVVEKFAFVGTKADNEAPKPKTNEPDDLPF